MAITDTQKVDYLWKKLGYAATKTDTNANKKAPNEAIASPLQLRADKVMTQSASIPGTQPASSSGVAFVYPTSAPIETTNDGTASANRTWKTGVTDWISPEFGSTYQVKVYIHTSGDASNAASGGTQVGATGSGNNDEWFFDYQSGVLHFIGTNLPNGVSFSGKSVFIAGARYVGTFGVDNNGAFTFTDNRIQTTSTNEEIILDPAGTGKVVIDSDLNLDSNQIINVADPTSNQHAATKAYVDSQVTAQDLDFQGDSGGALNIDLDSETLTFTGGTGIDTSGSGNAVTFAIDSTVTTLTGSQTLTNKTLTTPIITTPVVNAGLQLKNGATSAGFLEFFEDSDNGTNKVTLIGPASTADVTVTLPAAADTLVGKATTDTLTNKSIDLANNTLTGSVAEFNSALQSDSFATLANSVTLTNKTLTSPVINAFTGTGNGSITGTLAITNTTTSDSLTITTTEDSSTAGPVISLKRNSSSPADADYIGQIKFQGENDADQEVLYAQITGKIGDMTDGTEDGIIEITHKKAGSNNISARFSSTKLMLINGTGLEVAGAATFSSDVAMSSQKITGLADPTSNQEAATKAYVDSQVSATDLSLGIAADSGSASTVSTSQTLTISGTSNEIETSVSGQAITIGLPDDVTIGSDLTVTGNLTVNGTTTTLATNNSTVEDSLIELNNGATSNSNDLGFIFERGSTGNNAAIIWDESADKFVLGTTTATGASTGNLTVATGTLVANIEGNVTGAVTGNADTATALATARNIGGVSFDGTGDINLPGVNQAGNQNTSGTAAIATTVTVTDNEATNENNVILFGAGAAGSGNIGVEADGNMTYNPSTGKITATGFIGALTGDASGNAGTATALETARNIAGQSFDGTGDITIASGDLSNSSAITLNTAAQTLTNKSLTAPILTGSSSAAGSILFKEDTDNGTNAVTLIGPAATADVTITLPASAGTVALTSDIASAGISSGNVATFGSGAVDDDFLRINGTAIEGRSASEVLSDIGGQAALTFGIANTNAVKIDSTSVADDEYARFTANGLESRSTAEVLSDIGAQASLTFGISNTNAVKVDSTSVADDEYARFTASGLESRSTAEVASDIGAATLAGTQTLTNKTLTAPTISATSTTVGGKIKFLEGTDNGTNGVTLVGAASTADVDVVLPATAGTLALEANVLALSGGTMTGAIAMGTAKITGMGDPTANQDAATKAYVDSTVSSGSTLITQGNSNVTVADSGTGNVTIEVDGTDRITTVAATTTTATGHSIVLGAASNSAGGSIKFLEGTDNGTNGVTLQGPASTADVTVTLPASADTLVGKATTDTLTNKTINGPDNTLTNIANGSLANSTITVARQGGNSTAVALGGTITFNNTANETTVAESSGTITIGLADDVQINNITVSQDAVVTGNLTVNGTTTTLATTNSVVEDSIIELNTGASSNSNDLGFIFERGSTGNNAAFIWDESADKFTLGTTTSTGAATGNITVSSGTLVAALEGNATTATTLATARNIAGQSFDGSAAITIASTDLSNSSAIALLTSTQTMTNKSLTAPILTGSSSAAGSILFKEDTDNGTNAVTLIGPAATADVTITLPASAGTVALTSDIASAGISSGNVATFTSGVADNDFLRVDGTAIEGRSASEVLSDIGGQAALTFGISNTNAVKIDSTSVADDEYARFTANGLESRSTAEVLSDIGGQAALTFGISNTNAVKVDSTSVADDEYARFTASGLESRSTAEVASDIGAATLTGTQTLSNKTLGATTIAGHIVPDTDDAYDLGSSSLKFKDLYLSGSSLFLEAFSLQTHASGITFNHSSNTTLLPVGGGSHTLATLTATQTLTNKTLTNPTINAFTGTGNGTITGNLTVSANVDADNVTTDGLKIVDNNVMSTRSNDNINLIPSGTGKVNIAGLLFPITDGSDGHVLKTDGAGNLSFGAESGSTAGHTIQNGGSNLTQRAGLNFDGTHLVATDDSGNGQTDVTVSSTLQTIAGKTFPSGAIVGSTDSQTLTTKVINSNANTIHIDLDDLGTFTGTLAEFNAGLQGDSFVSLTGSETLTNKTLTTPALTTPALTTPTVATNIDLLARAELRFKDADSSHYVGFEAPATISANLIWVLPATDGANTQVLTTDGSGNLSWTDGGGGGGASTLGGLNDVTVSSAATNDLIVYTGSGFENKAKHEVAPTVPFTKADGTAQVITLENAYDLTSVAGFLNDRVVQKYKMPFVNAAGASVSTFVVTLDDIAGNAAGSAATLTTARNIGGVSFDGSANIDLPGVNAAGNQDTTGTASLINATANNSTDESVFLTFVDGATGSQGIETDTGLTYNPSSGNLTSTLFTGTATNARYADLAEMYAADSEIDPGTVVMFAGEGKVVACDRNNCRRVAGIVSTNPAHLMNSTQDGVALALAGRVPCKVIGPVQAGDLMVSAGNGRAMANNDALTGTIIGKAIEENIDGEGVIEVLALMM